MLKAESKRLKVIEKPVSKEAGFFVASSDRPGLMM